MATKNQTLPMIPAARTADTEPLQEHARDGARPRSADVSETDPSVPSVVPSGPRAEGLEEILGNMGPSRIWSPNAVVGAASNGADFAAYQAGAHAAAKAHDAKPSEARVEVNVTTPDLAALVERAKKAPERDDRGATTMDVRRGAPSRKVAQTAKVIGAASVVGVVVAIVVGRSFVGRPDPGAQGPSHVAANTATGAKTVTSAVTSAPRSVTGATDERSSPMPLAAVSDASMRASRRAQEPTPEASPSPPNNAPPARARREPKVPGASAVAPIPSASPAPSPSSTSPTAKYFPEERY